MSNAKASKPVQAVVDRVVNKVVVAVSGTQTPTRGNPNIRATRDHLAFQKRPFLRQPGGNP